MIVLETLAILEPATVERKDRDINSSAVREALTLWSRTFNRRGRFCSSSLIHNAIQTLRWEKEAQQQALGVPVPGTGGSVKGLIDVTRTVRRD